MKFLTFLSFTFFGVVCFTLAISCTNDSLRLNQNSLSFTHNINVTDKVYVDYFKALPAELVRMILTYLTPKHLFDFAQCKQFAEYHVLAAEAYGLCYKDLAVTAKGLEKAGVDFVRDKNAISFRNITVLRSFLRTFNKYVRNVKMDFSPLDTNDLLELIDTIKENCANSLTRFEMRNIFRGELKLLQNMSFANVEEVSFFNCDIRAESVQLTQLFPKVRRLSAFLTDLSDGQTWIEHNIINLTHLMLHVDEQFFRNQDITNILKRNPSVKSLGLFNSSPDLLHSIDEQFPHIVNLGLQSISYEFKRLTQPIRMEHVERFLYEGEIRQPLRHFIEFKNLKELYWRSTSKPDHILIKLIQDNRHTIEAITIHGTVISDGYLSKMYNMTQLRRAAFHLNPKFNLSFSANGFISFIVSNEQIEEVQLFEVRKKLRQDLLAIFNGRGIAECIHTFELQSNGRGIVVYMRNRNHTPTWDNSIQFFTNNFVRK